MIYLVLRNNESNDLAEKVVDINLAEIDSFKNHPFKVVFNAELFHMAESIKEKRCTCSCYCST